jgi:hypothetical protein
MGTTEGFRACPWGETVGMAEDQRPEPADQSGDEPSLELPSLRSAFRRKKPRTNPPVARASRVVPPRFPQGAALVTTPAAPAAPPPVEEESSREPPTEPKRRRDRKGIRLHLPGAVAALLTGAVVGLALVGLTSAALHLCTTWRGTSSCGKPGILLVLAITVIAAGLGAVLLRLLGVATAGSTSLLGVGLLGVLILLVLLPVVDRGWMVVAVPALSMLTHLAAWWLTTTYVEPGERPR